MTTQAKPDADAIDMLADQIAELTETTVKRLGDLERIATDADLRVSEMEAKANRPSYSSVSAPYGGTRQDDEHAKAFSSWLRDPRNSKGSNASVQLAEVEAKTASGLTDAAGGFIVPEIIQGPLLSRARDTNTLRPIMRQIQVASGDVVLPLSNADATSGWVGETDTRAGTTEPTLNGPKPTFGTLYALVEATEELVMDATFDVADWFSTEAGAALGEAESIALVTGNGSNRPTGLLNTAPESGADGSRTAGTFRYLPSGTADSLGSDASAVSDNLADLVYDLKAGYRSAGRWIMNSATAGLLRKLKDADGRMLWSDGLAAGEPARLLGYPVTLCEAMPDVAANAHPIGFGDWNRAYVIADRGALRVTVDDNITQPGRVRWYIRRRVGGITFDEHAARFLKCAAS